MNTLQLNNINLSFGDRDLLKDVSFSLDSNSRSALAGGNGEGKSTLLKIASNLMSYDSGTITKTKDLNLCYLAQSDIVLGDNTVYEEIEKAFDKYSNLIIKCQEFERQLELDPTNKVLPTQINEIHETLNNSDYYQRTQTISIISKGLGFKNTDLSRTCNEFSGGYQMRIALARVLCSHPDIMLLDEPTNYLDIEARIWLKNFLKTYDGGVMLVCHDRDFLDETVVEVYELCNGKLTRYKGNYTTYEKLRQQEIQVLEAAYAKQQEEIASTEAFIERFRYKATKAKQVQSRIKMLDKIEPIFVPSHLKKLSFSFPEPPHSPNDMVVVDKLNKSYGSHVIYKDLDLIINKGDYLAVTGQNGTGKSTLLRLIAGVDNQFSGTIKLGPGVKIGYFAQDNETYLNRENNVLEEVSTCATTAQLPKLRNILGNFLFQGDDIFKKVSVLSGGERSRIALLKILLTPSSLLILDEPTNHLDINAQEMLLDALKQYTGTLVFVSHDKHFISKLATKILYLSDNKPELFVGDYDYFSYKLEQKEAIEKVEKPIKIKETVVIDDYKQDKKRKNQIQKLKNECSNLLDQVAKIKEQIKEIQMKLELPENYSDVQKAQKLVDEKTALETKESELEELWFEKSMTLEEMES